MSSGKSPIDVEIQTHKDGRLDEVGIMVRAHDGHDLTAQEIMDAVGEALLIEYPNFSFEPIGDLDS